MSENYLEKDDNRAYLFFLSSLGNHVYIPFKQTETNGNIAWLYKLAEWNLEGNRKAMVYRVGFSRKKAKEFLDDANTLTLNPDLIQIVDPQSRKVIAHIWKPNYIQEDLVEVSFYNGTSRTTLMKGTDAILYIAKCLRFQSEMKEQNYDLLSNFYIE